MAAVVGYVGSLKTIIDTLIAGAKDRANHTGTQPASTVLGVPTLPNGATGAKVWNPVTGVYNWRIDNTSVFHRARGKAFAGTGFCRIHVIGDSTTAGTGSGSTEIRLGSPVTRLRQLLTTAWPATNVAEGVIWLGQDTSDTRIVYGSGWAPTSGGGLYNNNMQTQDTTGGATGLMQITLPPCTEYTVYGTQTSGYGTLSIGTDGGTPTNKSTAGSDGFWSTTVTGLTAAAHTVELRGVTGKVQVIAVEARNGISGVLVSREAKPGQTVQGLVQNGAAFASLQAAFAMRAADVALINLGINDRTALSSVATYKANITTAVTTAIAAGTLPILVLANTPHTSPAGAPAWTDYAQVLVQVADAYDIPVINLADRLPATNTDLYTDTVHPNAAGYWDIASAYALALAA